MDASTWQFQETTSTIRFLGEVKSPQWQKCWCSWACYTTNTRWAGCCTFLCVPWHLAIRTQVAVMVNILRGYCFTENFVRLLWFLLSNILHTNTLTKNPGYFSAPTCISAAIKCFVLATSAMEVACLDSLCALHQEPPTKQTVSLQCHKKHKASSPLCRFYNTHFRKKPEK